MESLSCTAAPTALINRSDGTADLLNVLMGFLKTRGIDIRVFGWQHKHGMR
jgi:hypothetical protein